MIGRDGESVRTILKRWREMKNRKGKARRKGRIVMKTKRKNSDKENEKE